MKARLIEWFDDHYYKADLGDGNYGYYPSITTKLSVVDKPQLAQWRGDIGNREANHRMFESQQRGKRIHAAWECYTQGGAVIYQPWERPNYTDEEIERIKTKYEDVFILQYQDEMLDVWKLEQWTQAVKPIIHYSETIFVSHIFQDGCTVDNVMYIPEGDYMVNGAEPLHIPDGNYIVDLKTGKSVYDEAFMQLAGNRNCFTESTGVAINGAIILHTQGKVKKGIPGLGTILRTTEQLDEDFSDFRNVAKLWERKNGDKKPKNFEFPSFVTMKVKV